MKVFCTTARSVPEDSYISSHACSNPRENPTSATNAPIPIPIPHKVRHVLRRLRHTFFQAKFASVNVELIPLPEFASCDVVLLAAWFLLDEQAIHPTKSGSHKITPDLDFYGFLRRRVFSAAICVKQERSWTITAAKLRGGVPLASDSTVL